MRTSIGRSVLLSALAATGAAIACDSPSGIVEHTASLAVRPQFNVADGAFGGLTIDKVELIAVRVAGSAGSPLTVSATGVVP